MLRRTATIVLTLFFLSVPVCTAQDLGQLRARVTKFWELRKQGDRLGVLDLIEPQSKQNYLKWKEAPFISFKVTGLEFTDDSNQVIVTGLVHFLLPKIGEIDRAMHDLWVWKDAQWFFIASNESTLANAYKADERTTAPSRIPPAFNMASRSVDLGRRAQGDLLEGKIPFKGQRSEILVIQAFHKIPGLVFGAPVWNGDSEGVVPYSWNTTLVSENVDQPVSLEAKGTNDEKTSIDVRFRLQVDAKVSFKQVPEVWDTSQTGKTELQIRNLSTKPLKLLSVVSQNRAFTIDDKIPELIDPGKTGTLIIHFSGTTEPAPVSVQLALSETLGKSPMTIVPLNIKLPDAPSNEITKEQLDRIRRQYPAPALTPH
jgi:hypothetical protein